MSDFLEKSSHCHICGSSDIREAFEVYYWRENPLAFYDCTQCEAVFANPMPGDALISAGNNALVRYYGQNRTFEQEFRDARQAYLRGKMLASKLRRWKKKGRLLELGCYQGFYGLGIRENCDWDVEGLEISSELQEFVQNTLKITCHLGVLESAGLPADHYDFVVCHDLIEHVNQPNDFLEQLVRILAPGGRVQIITPNAKQDLAYSRRAFKAGRPVGMLLNHISYFSPKTLHTALLNSGLTPLSLYCYDVRHAPKDFGWLGAQVPATTPPIPSMKEALSLPPSPSVVKEGKWTREALTQLRTHPKVSPFYGFFKESLPQFFTLRVPPSIGIGHEIFGLAEKSPERPSSLLILANARGPLA